MMQSKTHETLFNLNIHPKDTLFTHQETSMLLSQFTFFQQIKLIETQIGRKHWEDVHWFKILWSTGFNSISSIPDLHGLSNVLS
jgi:hypothetical protein